jgi:hypothetical protein
MLQLRRICDFLLRTALAVACLALCCSCMPLETPSPFVLRSWPHIEQACTGTGAQTTACTNAIIRASASEQPTAMLVASASWRYAQGDVYGSAHALRSALALLDSSSSKTAAVALESTVLFQEIMRTLQRVLDIATPPPLRPPPTPTPTPSLSTLYPAQITPFSEFAAALLSVCRNLPALRVVVEVGSGAGAGASSAIIAGILRRPGRLDRSLLACLIEVGAERRARLTQRYAHLPFVRIIAASAVPLSAFPSAADVSAAHAAWSSPEFSVSDALKWRQEDWDYLQLPGTVHDGIGIALAAAQAFVGGAAELLLGGDAVDVAVLDGSEFCGWQELRQLYGARVIALDDTRALKHRRSREFLHASGCYTVLADMLHDRNGWAIFERTPGSVCAPFPP